MDSSSDQVGGNQVTVGNITNSSNVYIAGGDIIIQRENRPPIRLQLPPRPTHFHGRDSELAQILASLQPGRIFTLCGPGGIGKTALASKALWQLTGECKSPPEQFSDGVFYHTFYGQPDINRALEAVARFFGEELKPSPAAAAQRALVGRCALLYLDGAEDASDLTPLLNLRGRCGVLISSRDRKHLTLDQGLNLTPLPMPEALALLKELGGEQAAAEEPATQLCQQLDCHPLTLRLAGSYISVTQEPVENSASWLRTALESGAHRTDNLLLLYRRSLNRLTPAARDLLSIIGLLAFAPFESAWLAAALDREEAQVNTALGELARYSLATRTGSLAQLSHVFIHSYTYQERPPSAETIQTLAAFFIRFAEEQTARGKEGFVALDPTRPHILGLLQHLEGASAWQSMLDLSSRFENYLDLHGYWAERLALIQCALRASQQLTSLPDQSIWLGNLGNTYLTLGEPCRAIECYEQALEIDQQIGDRLGIGNSLGSLGMAYTALGEIQQAIVYSEQALQIARQTGDRHGEAARLGNLGTFYADLGEARRAIVYYKQALDIDREVGDQRGEGAELGNLGTAYMNLGEPRRAIELYGQALEIDCEIGDRRGKGAGLGNLGIAYMSLGETQQAIEYFEQALKITREIGDRLLEGARLGNLGAIYADLGEMKLSFGYYEQALEIARQIGDQRNEGIHLGNMGLAYKKQGDVKKAIEYYDQALKIAWKIGDRYNEGKWLGNKGNAYADLGEVHLSIKFNNQSLKIAQEIDDRILECNTLSNLGSIFFSLGKPSRAIKYLEQALEIARLIDDQFRKAKISRSLGMIYWKQGDLPLAYTHLSQAFNIFQEVLPPTHPDILSIIQLLSSIEADYSKANFKF